MKLHLTIIWATLKQERLQLTGKIDKFKLHTNDEVFKLFSFNIVCLSIYQLKNILENQTKVLKDQALKQWRLQLT
jgi:hypothetical protein